MGLLDSLLGANKNNDENSGNDKSSATFDISTSFSPLRLSANRASYVELLVKIKNISNSPTLVSLDASVPKTAMIGFDSGTISKSVEKKAGELAPSQSVEIKIPIWSNNQTKANSYSLDLVVYSHYLSYNKVISSIKKSTSIRAV